MREFRPLRASYRLRGLVAAVCILLGCSCAGPEQSTAGSKPSSGTPKVDAGIQRDQAPTARTLYSMADILATQGKDTECEFVLRRCIHEYPQFTPAYNSLAELQMRQGRVNEATEVLSEALRVRPRDPVLLNNLGMSFLVRKKYEKALEHFIAAAGLIPESEKYRANAATALGLLGRHEESLALLRQVLPEDKAMHNAEVLRRAHEKEAVLAPATQS